jgi:uncharacterized membrane protein
MGGGNQTGFCMKSISAQNEFGQARKWTVLVLALGAAATSAYLTWTIGFELSPLGCGEEAGCDQVLKSRWSRLLGLPVSSLGVLLHLTAVACVLRFPQEDQKYSWIPRILVMVCVVGLAGACWFMFVQSVIVKQFCIWCMAVHCLAIAYGLIYLGLVLKRSNLDTVGAALVWVTPRQFGVFGLCGVLSVAGLIVIQATQAISFAVQKVETKIQVTQSESERGALINLFDGNVEIFFGELPTLGRQGGPPDVLFLYDYCCPHCRISHRRMKGQIHEWPEHRIALLPVPLNSDCNKHWRPDWQQHSESCQLTKLALAIWRIDQETFGEFDDWLCAAGTRTKADAFAKARKLVGAQRLDEALDDPWIEETMKTSSQTLHESGATALPTFLQLTDKVFEF